MKRLSFVLALALIAMLASVASASAARQLFAPHYGTDKLAVFNSDPASGGLAAISGSPFAAGSGGTTSFSMTPDGNIGIASFLYGGFHPFAIAADGTVTPTQAQVSWPAGVGSYQAAVSPNGKFVYGANRVQPAALSGNGIRAYALSSAGGLTEVAGSPYVTAEEFFDVALTPDGTRIIGVGASGVYHGLVGADGTLGTLTPQTVAGTYYVAVSPDGRFAFLAGSNGTGFIRVFAIAADGALTAVGSPIPLGSGTPRALVVSPSGEFVYSFDANTDKVFTARIAPDGTPSLVATPTDFIDPYQSTISPDGKFLYVTNTGSEYSMNVSPIGTDGRPTGFTKSVPYDAGEPSRIVFRPGQGTVAAVKATIQSKKLTFKFDSAGTSAVAGSVGAYSWDFGDGAKSAAAALTHSFAKPGVYDVTLTASDDNGCSSKFIYNGQSTICNGKASATKTLKIDTPPWITSLKVSPSKVGKSTKIKFVLTEKASVSFFAQKPVKGRTVGTKCKKQTAKNKKAKKCTLWVRASKTFRKSGKAGKTNSVKFTGKIGKTQLANGKYRLFAVATDAAKGKGPSKTAAFKIKRKK
jgi:6-phosphogluconolactonase (cycloisomerase 2 family)